MFSRNRRLPQGRLLTNACEQRKGTKLAHPRIQLIHAVSVAQGPIHGAFDRLWPEARIADLTEASLATDLADYLVTKGVPFREAHGVVRELCRHCESQDKDLQQLSLDEYHRFSPQFDEGVYRITAESSAAAEVSITTTTSAFLGSMAVQSRLGAKRAMT